MTKALSDLRVKLFADGADTAGLLELYAKPYIKGFTTNPTLMRKAGISDYRAFARDVLTSIKDRPISFEVFADDVENMERQAKEISTWGDNVYVKIPVTNTKSRPTTELVHKLSHAGVKLNITALMTVEQVRTVTSAVIGGAPCCISVFAGRIADSGRDPMPIMRQSVEIMRASPNAELIWASPRELLNVMQAEEVGCHIITATNDILKKLELIGKDLTEFSLDTVKMFHEDATKAGFAL
jgi:transaldolase